ncbi:hydroxylamine reductase [Anoxybacterium hadale]|uniref:Hydroxylamine reductase n=1 Tax=Anoxybacterium hadale TaxID=3408580 RepID=A0ACD1AG73_9FIRM|nr:hydroxylamine reductase [Clostridiales bacterium]
MGMFCYQCQETGRGTGCEYGGVCGKSEELADFQDLLIYTIKGIAEIIVKGGLDTSVLSDVNREVLRSLFMTITNANFDEEAVIGQIQKMIGERDKLRELIDAVELHDAATYEIGTMRDMIFKASYADMTGRENKDVRSLKHLILFGIKGLAAYTYHALQLGKEKQEIYQFIYEALNATLDDRENVEHLTSLVMKTGQFGVEAMALLDAGNTERYGNPEITEVSIETGENPAILVSGHDLTDLEELLVQTQGTGVDVYTHGEMLPAHYYPEFKKYKNFVGNYGNAWWQQEEEFKTFHGPILFTTNCIVPPISEEVRNRIFTTGATGYPGCTHIGAGADGKKDFSQLIELAKKLESPLTIEHGSIIGGFAHAQVFALADKVVDAVKSGAIRKFVVMAGCDGRMQSREYYTEFAEKLPKDTVILTAGCAKYRYNKLSLGTIGDIPRVLDAGQCNDSYSLALIALKLKEVFDLSDINELPIVYNIAWYEQKAVIVLLALLYLGVKNIRLGPTLPAFLSPNILKFLVDHFGICGINSVSEDLLNVCS